MEFLLYTTAYTLGKNGFGFFFFCFELYVVYIVDVHLKFYGVCYLVWLFMMKVFATIRYNICVIRI